MAGFVSGVDVWRGDSFYSLSRDGVGGDIGATAGGGFGGLCFHGVQLFLQKGSVEKKVALFDNLIANAAEDARLKEKLYEENQIDHTDYLAALTSQERYVSSREELLAQVEILNVSIDTVIGKYEEEE